ncbi:uncharacterized protein METZ01_LOCUS141266 [marine metagenome]|uniref:Uncharacterized protein n=1 Tax=marine metagenome TaxID=408172 RepID=A0A381ZHW2_9ZZZZ
MMIYLGSISKHPSLLDHVTNSVCVPIADVGGQLTQEFTINIGRKFPAFED